MPQTTLLQPCSFVTFFFYDTKHQRSNVLSHLSIGIMEARKNEYGLLEDIRLVNSYGYYSHKIPEGGITSLLDTVLKKLANVSFRIRGSYAEFKQEDLINIDLGFGITGGPIIEITSEERKTLEEKFAEILESERKFFQEADRAAEQATNDARNVKKFEDNKIFYREQHYQKAVDEVDQLVAQHPEEDFLIEETAYCNGLISKERLQKEKLKAFTGISMFEVVPSPEGSTCKTLGINLVMQSLADDEFGKIRKLLLSQMLDNYYTQAIPLLSTGCSKILYHSLQDTYTNVKAGSVCLPGRNWNNVSSCLFVGTDNNTYIDLAGKEHTLQVIDRKKDYFNLLENLFHLKRLLNDFATNYSDFNNFIKIIDDAVLSMMKQAHDIQTVTRIYHTALKNLDQQRCFDQVGKEIFALNVPLNQVRILKCPNHLRLESGVAEELYRLKQMAAQAKQPEFKLNDTMGFGAKMSAFFHRQIRPATAESETDLHQLLERKLV